MDLTVEELTLLEYVYDQAGRDTRRNIDLPADDDGKRVSDAARRLVAADLLEFASYGGDVYVTQRGLAAVEKVRQRRNDRPARTAAVRLALINWLYDYYVDGVVRQSTEEFLASDRSYYAGRQVAAAEVNRAVVYLKEQELIEGASVGESVHLFQPNLTSRGLDCAESGKAVSEFVASQASSGPIFNVQIDGSQNVVVGTQSDFTQNNTSGIDAEVLTRLVHFATIARQSLPGSGLDEQQQAVADHVAQELEAEATNDAPDRGRLRKLADRLVDALAPAAGTALGGVVMALGQQAVAAISG
jgi:hypothetical protein